MEPLRRGSTSSSSLISQSDLHHLTTLYESGRRKGSFSTLDPNFSLYTMKFGERCGGLTRRPSMKTLNKKDNDNSSWINLGVSDGFGLTALIVFSLATLGFFYMFYKWYKMM